MSKTLIPSTRAGRQSGVSIIEMMIGMAVGLILMAGVIAFYGTSVRSSKSAMDMMRLNHDLRAAMQLMANDIRRAGYYGNADNDIGSGANTNPFMDASSGYDIGINADGDCILYTYDVDDDGVLDTTGTNDERFGFRLNDTDGTVEMRQPENGGNFSCTDGTWAAINDANAVEVTALSLAQSDTVLDADASTGSSTLTIREITIGMTGQLADDVTGTNASRTLLETVRVRNDKFIP